MNAADVLPKIVLCADDDPDDIEVICTTIKQIEPSYEVVCCVNGVDVLAKLELLKQLNRLPCLIVLDMNMPKMSGQETLEELRKDRELATIPVVIFTTSQKELYADYSQKHDIAVVTKPSSMNVIENEVKKLLDYCN